MGKRLWPWILVVLALSVSLLIQDHLPEVSPSTNGRGEFSVAVTAEPNSLDPALAENGSALAITDNVFQTLLHQNANGALTPDLARQVTVHGHVLQVTLAKAKTTQGNPVTASMVAESLARPLWTGVNSKTARALLAPVVGYSSVVGGHARYLSGVKVTGRTSLRITLAPTANIAHFLHGLSNRALAIVPVSDQTEGQSNWQFSNLIGTTPWRLQTWIPGFHLVFDRYTRGRGPGQIDVVVYPKPEEAWLSVVNGVVDAAPIGANHIASLRRRWRRDLHAYPGSGQVALYYRLGSGKNSGYPGISIAAWVHRALGAEMPVSSTLWPAALAANRPMTIWVNATNLEAVALAESLARLEPKVAIRQGSARILDSLAATGAITAYIGTRSRFRHPFRLPLTESAHFWMQSRRIRSASLYPDGQFNWSSIRMRG